MVSFFSDTYSRNARRLRGYDYSSPGKYFITINTKGKSHYLGEVENGKMNLSESGLIVQKLWLEIPLHYPIAELDEFAVMPDHIHGIIIISKAASSITLKSGVDPPKFYHIGVIINQFKRASSVTVKKSGLELVWQPRYYDHIIRNRLDFNRTRQYIIDNPKNYHYLQRVTTP